MQFVAMVSMCQMLCVYDLHIISIHTEIIYVYEYVHEAPKQPSIAETKHCVRLIFLNAPKQYLRIFKYEDK